MITVDDIQPIMLYLPEDGFKERMELGRKHFAEQGLKPIECWGIHADAFGLVGSHPYLGDDPNRTIPQGSKDIGSYLSHYIMYNMINAMDKEFCMICEDDCRFVDGWREKLNQALADCPEFDVLFVGSCCTSGLRPRHEKGMIFSGIYPMCGHCYIIRKRAIGLFLSTQRDTANPTDISLRKLAFPHLKVYTILPRLAEQWNNPTLER